MSVLLGQAEWPVCRDEGQASQRGLGAERPVCQAERPVCRDEGQAKQRGLFSQNKITQFPQVQAFRDSQILIKRFVHKRMRNSSKSR